MIFFFAESRTRFSLSFLAYPCCWLAAHNDPVKAHAGSVVTVKAEETTFQESFRTQARRSHLHATATSPRLARPSEAALETALTVLDGHGCCDGGLDVRRDRRPGM